VVRVYYVRGGGVSLFGPLFLFSSPFLIFSFQVLSSTHTHTNTHTHTHIRQTTNDEDDDRAKGVSHACVWTMYMYIIFIYIHTEVGPGFRGPAVTRVAKREIELHFRDVCVIPSRAHTHAALVGRWRRNSQYCIATQRAYMYIRIIAGCIWMCGYVGVCARAPEFTLAWTGKKKNKNKGRKNLSCEYSQKKNRTKKKFKSHTNAVAVAASESEEKKMSSIFITVIIFTRDAVSLKFTDVWWVLYYYICICAYIRREYHLWVFRTKHFTEIYAIFFPRSASSEHAHINWF